LKFFSRNKETSNPAIIINRSLEFLLNRITDDVEREEYSWDKSWGVKRFESIILAKFILDYSFERIAEGQLSDDEKYGYYDLSNTSFSSLFNKEFSEVGMNFDDMQKEIEEKIETYFTANRENPRPPARYYQIYMLLTGSRSRGELEEKAKMITLGLKLLRNNVNFATMVTQYEDQIKCLKKQVVAFDLAEIMLPHIFRSARQKIKNINLKKIQVISNKLAKKDKKK